MDKRRARDMAVVAGLVGILMAGLFLWIFSPVVVSLCAGLAVGVLLWQPIRWWRRRHWQRSLQADPAMDAEQAARHPFGVYVGLLLAVWGGCAAMLATAVSLPDTWMSADLLPLAAAPCMVASVGVLIYTIGAWISTRQSVEQAQLTLLHWKLAACALPMLALPISIFWVPDSAGWMAWREQLRGYPSTQLRIPLRTDSEAHRQAVLTVVQPWLVQGSRVVSFTSRSRNGSSYTLRATVPARYRFEDGALVVQYAGVLSAAQRQVQQQALDALAGETLPAPTLLAYAQCQPSPQTLARQRMLGQARAVFEALRACTHAHSSALQSALPTLQGQLLPVQLQQLHFSPWLRSGWNGSSWKAVALPEGEALQALDSLR